MRHTASQRGFTHHMSVESIERYIAELEVEYVYLMHNSKLATTDFDAYERRKREIKTRVMELDLDLRFKKKERALGFNHPHN